MTILGWWILCLAAILLVDQKDSASSPLTSSINSLFESSSFIVYPVSFLILLILLTTIFFAFYLRLCPINRGQLDVHSGTKAMARKFEVSVQRCVHIVLQHKIWLVYAMCIQNRSRWKYNWQTIHHTLMIDHCMYLYLLCAVQSSNSCWGANNTRL